MTKEPRYAPFKASGPSYSGPPKFVKEDGIYVVRGLHLSEDRQLDQLNRDAKEHGWRGAVETAYGPERMAYVDNYARVRFLHVLPLNENDLILEIGTSLGQIIIPLSKRVGSADGLEVVIEQAKFCAERCRQEGVTNVRITAGGSDCTLPYAEASFDGVILNLVLEWCGQQNNHPHEESHGLLLSEINRVLKPGGFLFLNTKNRYALRLLTGGADEHMYGMPFGSALPRRISRLFLRGRRQLGYLHSYSELSRLTKKSGFSKIESFWLAPDIRWPTDIILLEPNILATKRRKGGFSEGESRRTRAIMKFMPDRLVKYFAPGLTFLAYKLT
jgi:SAM-dependent methyltransferase